jgi:hypothetical protein
MFYTENAELEAELNSPLQDALGSVTFAILSAPDRDWRAYRWLLKAERRKPFGVAALCAVLLLCGVAVLHGYGPAWAAGEVLAPVLLLAAAIRFRKGAQWYLDHRLRMFGGYTLMLAVILFGFLSLSPLTVWGAFAVSLAAGAVLVASVWKAQLRFWRERVPRSPAKFLGVSRAPQKRETPGCRPSWFTPGLAAQRAACPLRA